MNKFVGIIIIFTYFANYHICNLIYPNDVVGFWDLKVSIYCILIVLSLKYKSINNGVVSLIESVFISIIINNIVVNFFFQERNYSYSDLILIPLIISIEYAKHYKINCREYLRNIIGGHNIDNNNKN